jgi:hypothetical protein
MLKKEKVKILIVIGVFVALLGVFLLTSNIIPRDTSIISTSKEENNKTVKTILEINQVKYESEITEPISVYEFMEKLQNERKITFKDKTYTGMGKLIEEINGLKSEGDKYWIYYVNNKEAQIGISDYKINPGDTVSWKYEKSKY